MASDLLPIVVVYFFGFKTSVHTLKRLLERAFRQPDINPWNPFQTLCQKPQEILIHRLALHVVTGLNTRPR